MRPGYPSDHCQPASLELIAGSEFCGPGDAGRADRQQG